MSQRHVLFLIVPGRKRPNIRSEHPINIPDPIRKRFGYGQLWPLWPTCSQTRAGKYMPDLTSRIQFGSIFPKKARIILYKADPGPMWIAWSGFAQTHLFWKQAIIGPGFWQNITGPPPVSHRLGCVLSQTARILLCKKTTTTKTALIRLGSG